MASGVAAATTYSDVMMEPFNDFLTAPWSISGSPTCPTGGRTGKCAQMQGNFTDAISFAIPSAKESDTLTCGLAFKTAGFGSETHIVDFFSDAGATQHAYISYNSAGSLLLYIRGFSGVITSAGGLLPSSTWTYIELQIKLHDTLGTYNMKVNGTSIGSATNVDTKNAGTKTTFDTVKIVTRGAVGFYDDMYITMGVGAPFKGPITIP